MPYQYVVFYKDLSYVNCSAGEAWERQGDPGFLSMVDVHAIAFGGMGITHNVPEMEFFS